MAHFSLIGESGIPISSSSSSLGSSATSPAFRPFTSSVSIDVAACEIAQPRPSSRRPRSSRRLRRTARSSSPRRRREGSGLRRGVGGLDQAVPARVPVILDHYRSPRLHGCSKPPTRTPKARILLRRRGEDLRAVRRRRRDDRGRRLRGARLRDLAGRHVDAHRAAQAARQARSPCCPKEELLDEIGIPALADQAELAILGWASSRWRSTARGTPLPEEWRGSPKASSSTREGRVPETPSVKPGRMPGQVEPVKAGLPGVKVELRSSSGTVQTATSGRRLRHLRVHQGRPRASHTVR